jgi:hypothetical protein
MTFSPFPFSQTQKFNSLTTWYFVKRKNCTCMVHNINPKPAKDAWNIRSNKDGR